MSQTKQKLRSIFIAKRREVSSAVQADYRKKLVYHLQAYLKDNSVINTVLSYCHYASEVPTDYLNGWLLACGFNLALPRMEEDEICFYQVNNLSTQLKYNGHPMLEPDKKLCDKIDVTRSAIVLTPGLAFDFGGGRLGSGRGFYDRLFVRYPHLHRVGIAYEVQMTSSLPCQEHDMPLHVVMTEKNLYLMR